MTAANALPPAGHTIEVQQQPAPMVMWRTAAEIRAQVNLIQEVMRAVMKENVHYGVIPGCDKPSLWKPGAEILFATFRIAADPVVEDLSTEDEARFRVTVHATSSSGNPLGSCVGECSSGEEKYKWRKVVCSEEWDATPEDRKRLKWKKGERGAYSIMQIRTQPADVRNTVLKLALKRGFVGLAMQVTAASDIFTQDIEDLPDEVREEIVNERAQNTGWQDLPDLPADIRRKPVQQATQTTSPERDRGPSQPTAAARVGTGASVAASAPVSASGNHHQPVQRTPQPSRAQVISEPQARRFYAIWKDAGKTKEEVSNYLHDELGVASDREIPVDRYQSACAWAERSQGGRW